MTVEEIKKAIENGKKVYWKNGNYEVIKDKVGQYLIHCISTNSYMCLTWRDEVTMNGEEGDFFINENWEWEK